MRPRYALMLAVVGWACRSEPPDDSPPDASADAAADGGSDSDAHADDACDVDRDGHPALSCGGDDCDDGDVLVHPGAPDGAWSIEVIERGRGIGYGASLAIDAKGFAHVGYVAADSDSDFVPVFFEGDYRYASNVSGRWRSWTLSSDAEVPYAGTRIAIDGNGDPFLCTFPPDQLPPRCGGARDGNWSPEVLDFVGRLFGFALAIDSAGAVRIAFSGTYATDASGDWVTEAIRGSLLSLAIGPGGETHVAGLGDELGESVVEMLYGTSSGGAWSFEMVTVVIQFTNTAIAVDGNGAVQIAYSSSGYLGYAAREAGAWNVTFPLDGDNQCGGEDCNDGSVGAPQLVLDPNEDAHILYCARATVDGHLGLGLKHATNAGGAWTIEIVDPVDCYPGSALAVDGAGILHAVYTDWTNGLLLHARRTGPDGEDQDCDGQDG